MKRADEILTHGMIDACLTANAGVYHGEQRRWDLHERHAAQDCRRDKAGHISDHAAAQGNHRRAALDSRGEKRVIHRLERSQRLVLLAGRNRRNDRLEIRRLQRADKRWKEMCRNVAIGEDGRALRGADFPQLLPGRFQQPRRYAHLVWMAGN